MMPVRPIARIIAPFACGSVLEHEGFIFWTQSVNRLWYVLNTLRPTYDFLNLA
jgi:hypothetical protein